MREAAIHPVRQAGGQLPSGTITFLFTDVDRDLAAAQHLLTGDEFYSLSADGMNMALEEQRV